MKSLYTSLIFFSSLLSFAVDNPREEVSFDLIPKNPMGFTVYKSSIGKNADSWAKLAEQLTDKKRKKQKTDEVYKNLFQYLCFQAKLKNPKALELSQSSLNTKFCASFTKNVASDEVTISALHQNLTKQIAALDAASAVGVVDAIAGIYSEAPLYRFAEDPEFLMKEVSHILQDVYQNSPQVFEERVAAENKDWKGYASDVVDLGLFVSAGVVGHRLVNNVLFSEILRGGAKSGPVSMMSLWLRKAVSVLPKVNPVPAHRWETRIINGKAYKMLKFDDPIVEEKSGICVALFSNLARNIAIAGVWSGAYFGLLHDEVQEFLMARTKVLGDSHPIESLSKAQQTAIDNLSLQIEAQRLAFQEATLAAEGGKAAWDSFVENAIIEEHFYLRKAPFKKELSDEENAANIRKAIDQKMKTEMTNRFFALVQAWMQEDNTALVLRTAQEKDPNLRVQPSVLASHRSLLRMLSNDAVQLTKEKGSISLKGQIDGLEAKLIGDEENLPSISSLATKTFEAYTKNIGLE